jgi:hypothetical protein
MLMTYADESRAAHDPTTARLRLLVEAYVHRFGQSPELPTSHLPDVVREAADMIEIALETGSPLNAAALSYVVRSVEFDTAINTYRMRFGDEVLPPLFHVSDPLREAATRILMRAVKRGKAVSASEFDQLLALAPMSVDAEP